MTPVPEATDGHRTAVRAQVPAQARPAEPFRRPATSPAWPVVAEPLEERALVRLARRCLKADGGLPLAVEPSFLRRRWFVPGALTFVVRDAAAAARTAPVAVAPVAVAPASVEAAAVEAAVVGAVVVRPAPDRWTITGLVDPSARGRGIGGRLLDTALAAADGHPVTVETEGLTPAAEELFASRRLRQVFAEDVMRFDLTAAAPASGWSARNPASDWRAPTPAPCWPAGATVAEWAPATVERFHAVYAAAFRERPGFPDWPAEQWITDTAGDEGFRADWSLLATLPGAGDVGFITAAEGWIVQVGVVPAARRIGLAEALIRETLRRMASGGATGAWLDVNVDNPAASLYRRIGFRDSGRRAHYQVLPR